MKKHIGTLITIAMIVILIVVFSGDVASLFGAGPKDLNYKEFINTVEEDNVEAVKVISTTLYGVYRDSQNTAESLFKKNKYDFYCTIPSKEVLSENLSAIVAANTGKDASLITPSDYPFEYRVEEKTYSVFEMLLPYILLFGAVILFMYFMLRNQGGGKQMANFGKSRARATIGNQNRVRFDDVQGAEEEKEELKEVVDFLKKPKRFTQMGARIPKGILLVGPPGTGKTLLAKAAAGEANVPFFSISGSDFVEMFVGVGASRVRDLFNTAKKCAPALVFIDEIDAVGRQRGAGLGGGHDEREQTLNQLLVEMDGFATNEGIIVIAATNRPDILDPALLRPGRFDRQITVNRPDVRGRQAILELHGKNKPFEPDVDMAVIAKLTPGFTGADLENVLNEAAILAARYGEDKITMADVEEAITRVMLGPEKRSRLISDEEKRVTAYHEVGHAIIAHKLKNCDPVHEVSIIPRGMAAGYTTTLPENDHVRMSKSKLLDTMCMILGGRAAEAVALPDIDVGAYNDLQRASALARRMVTEFGMSDAIGPVFLGGQNEVFLGKEIGHTRDFSEDLAAKVDTEVRRILEEQYDRAKAILTEELDKLNDISQKLIDYERITGEQFADLYDGREIDIKPVSVRDAERNERIRKREEAEKQAKSEDKPDDDGKPADGDKRREDDELADLLTRY